MTTKGPRVRDKLGASRDRAKDKRALDALNLDIDDLKDNHLPHIPHLLLVDTKNPFLPKFPHENKGTPFEPWEVKALQYMTSIADGERGIALAKGDWEDEYAHNPYSNRDVRSSTTTPNPNNKDAKKASVKYSIKDYKSMKETGVKPSPRPQAVDSEQKPGHFRTTSVRSTGTPMSRVPSTDGGLASAKQNRVGSLNLARVDKSAREDRSTAPQPARSEAKSKPQTHTNGNVHHSKDHNKPTAERTSLPLRHGLPPRPNSPPRARAVSDARKRPLDTPTARPEKRQKIEQTKPVAASLSNSTRPRSDSKPSPVKSQKPQPITTQPSPLSKKAGHPSKVTGAKQSSKTHIERPHNLPPLLSPLPADLDSESNSQPLSSGFSKIRKMESGKNSASNTPNKAKLLNPDGKKVKSSTFESSPLSTPPKSSSSPFVLPSQLSPGLPEEVEHELNRLQAKSATLNTVEARHEKARQPDTPGVARKTVKSKVGHPPKKTHAESSKRQESEKPVVTSEIVKLSFKKPMRKRLEQLLRLKASLWPEFRRLEAIRTGTQLPPPPLRKQQQSDSEEEKPLAAIPKSKVASATAPTKKRALEVPEARAPEPPPKRKEKERIETPKALSTQLKPAFKSPAPSVPTEKNLLSTPKRGDAIKTVAMRRVDSSDGHARTPQGAAVSTPASAEKPRVNGEIRLPPNSETIREIEKLQAEEKRLTILANKVKHKMDDIMKVKNPQLRGTVTETDRKLGLSIGLEAITVYMNAFGTQMRHCQLAKRNTSSGAWESIIKLWEFMDSNCKGFATLQVLSAALGALVREELGRAGLESREYQNKETRIFELLKINSREKDRLWVRYHTSRTALSELGVVDVVGPWSEISEATRFAMDVLGAYSKKEKLNWKRDSGN